MLSECQGNESGLQVPRSTKIVLGGKSIRVQYPENTNVMIKGTKEKENPGRILKDTLTLQKEKKKKGKTTKRSRFHHRTIHLNDSVTVDHCSAVLSA